MQVQVRINEEGALRNQRFAFTDKFTLISELMQNARRAGAQRIEITYDETSGVLRVVDDGYGVTDFQKLLTFNESGWDKDTCDEERPFGIGFSKCLYSSSRCIVASRNRKIDFLAEDALARKPIDVVEITHHPHTAIELHAVRLPGLAGRLPHMCSGFTIATWFNGRELPRKHAIGHRPFLPADIGLAYLAGTADGRHTFHTLVFLQGLCVLRPVYYDDDHVNVVHLDSKQFIARLPDRDKLIDEEDQKKRIDASLKSLWRQVLLDAKTRMAAESFVDLYFEALRGWGHLDLLNDVPLLPRRVCERIVGYPIQQGYEDCTYLAPADHSVSRRKVEDGDVILVSLVDTNGDNAACWMVAKAKGYLVLSPASLHHDHWVHPNVRSLDEEAVRVDAVGEQCRVTLEGRWIWPLVVLCDAVVITVGKECVTVSEEGMYHGGSIFIPSGEWSGEPVRQASDFIDSNDQYLEDHCDEDRKALADLIRRLRSGDPRATLDSLLQELKLEKYPLLHGKVFQVTVGHDRGEHVVEVLQAPAAHSPSAEGRP